MYSIFLFFFLNQNALFDFDVKCDPVTNMTIDWLCESHLVTFVI